MNRGAKINVTDRLGGERVKDENDDEYNDNRIHDVPQVYNHVNRL